MFSKLTATALAVAAVTEAVDLMLDVPPQGGHASQSQNSHQASAGYAATSAPSTGYEVVPPAPPSYGTTASHGQSTKSDTSSGHGHQQQNNSHSSGYGSNQTQ